MFEDMRQAIEDVITQYRETGVKTEYVIDSQAIDTLEKVYNLYSWTREWGTLLCDDKLYK